MNERIQFRTDTWYLEVAGADVRLYDGSNEVWQVNPDRYLGSVDILGGQIFNAEGTPIETVDNAWRDDLPNQFYWILDCDRFEWDRTKRAQLTGLYVLCIR